MGWVEEQKTFCGGSEEEPQGTYGLCLSNWIAFQAVASNGPITVADGRPTYMAPEISLLRGIRETHTVSVPINKNTAPFVRHRHCHRVFATYYFYSSSTRLTQKQEKRDQMKTAMKPYS